MFAALPVLWSGFTGWITKNPIAIWIGGVCLFLIGWAKITGDIKEAAKKAECAANAQRNAEEHARTVDAAREVTGETRDAMDRAVEAADSLPEFRSADELRKQRPDLAAIVLGNRPGHGSGS